MWKWLYLIVSSSLQWIHRVLVLLLFVAFVKIRSAVCSWTPETNLLNEWVETPFAGSSPRRVRPAASNGRRVFYLFEERWAADYWWVILLCELVLEGGKAEESLAPMKYSSTPQTACWARGQGGTEMLLSRKYLEKDNYKWEEKNSHFPPWADKKLTEADEERQKSIYILCKRERERNSLWDKEVQKER